MSGFIKQAVQGLFDPVSKGLRSFLDANGGEFSTGLPLTLSQSAIPVILAPNGTVATNGTITLGTALPAIYANAWVRLPAGAVVGGAAGLYYATFSSTTVGVITTTFADAATAFTPYIPASTIVATGSNSAYTQTTAADITLANITVPGGLMGANGATRARAIYSGTNNANSKLLATKIGAASIAGGFALTSNIASNTDVKLANRGLSLQFGSLGSSVGSTPYLTYHAINTAVDSQMSFTAQVAIATDCIVLECYTIEVLPA
ncbi:hypothetical protein UFOVP61_1 [uncultured Caudovirales phage]|uniref:Uncharacterized protein n=1 Tax=uncultured Caudovirales phage TaxID=2100421 RepID=A0A6J5KTE2_9CAUD|nr:hypothetical protein UFOVP61_1 [uncultured Caudovirales phage]